MNSPSNGTHWFRVQPATQIDAANLLLSISEPEVHGKEARNDRGKGEEGQESTEEVTHCGGPDRCAMTLIYEPSVTFIPCSLSYNRGLGVRPSVG